VIGDDRIGEVVMWRSKHGCQFGYLESVGPKYARIKFGDRIRQALVGEVHQWPPPVPEKPQKKARRK
jgi:hypothetical protein